MAAPGNLNPLFDLVSVSYELINRNTLQPISHSGNYVEVNNSQFIFLKVHPQLTSFDKRAKKALLTFKQYTNLNYQVILNESNTAHLISSNQIPLRKYTSNNTICYEADITDLVASHPTREVYFALTTSSNMSFYVSGVSALANFWAYSIGVVAGATNEVLNTVASSRIVEHRLPNGDEIALAVVLGLLNGFASVGLGQLSGAGLSHSELYVFQKSFSTQFAYNLLVSRPVSFLNMAIELSYSSQKNKKAKNEQKKFFLMRLIK